MGFIELFEVGFFTALWNWSNPILTLLVYTCIAIGALLQFVLLKKCRKPAMRWSLLSICGIGIIISECACQVITGWDRLGFLIIYGFVICLMIGAGMTTAVLILRKRGKK